VLEREKMFCMRELLYQQHTGEPWSCVGHVRSRMYGWSDESSLLVSQNTFYACLFVNCDYAGGLFVHTHVCTSHDGEPFSLQEMLILYS